MAVAIAAAIVPQASATARESSDGYVVVMGDSFSSGEGSYPFHPERYEGGACRRATSAAGRSRLAERHRVYNIACSGATTLDMKGQVARLRAFAQEHDVERVVLTAGGNDVQFADQAKACSTYAGIDYLLAHKDYKPAIEGVLALYGKWKKRACGRVSVKPKCLSAHGRRGAGHWAELRCRMTDLVEGISAVPGVDRVDVLAYPNLIDEDASRRGPCASRSSMREVVERVVAMERRLSQEQQASLRGLPEARFVDTSDAFDGDAFCSGSRWSIGGSRTERRSYISITPGETTNMNGVNIVIDLENVEKYWGIPFMWDKAIWSDPGSVHPTAAGYSSWGREI